MLRTGSQSIGAPEAYPASHSALCKEFPVPNDLKLNSIDQLYHISINAY